MPDHKAALGLMLKALTHPETGVVKDLGEIGAVGHRIVHGGEFFSGSTLITEEVKEAIRSCSELAPLHNPANLTGIEACEALIPSVPMVGVFDTAFHQTMPTCTPFLTGIIRNMGSEDTASTEPATPMYPAGRRRFWDVLWRSFAPLSAIWATGPPCLR